jgi:hypothetical protein
LFVETLESASTSRFLSGYSKIKFYDLILHNIHCNGYGQIFKENLPQNQRFCVETSLFRLTITIIMVVERGNNSESVISTPNLRFGNKFSKKI